MKNIYVLLLSFFCYLHPNAAIAQGEDIIVSFNPSGNLWMGQSIDINNPGQTKLNVFTDTTLVWLDGASPFTFLKASLVTSTHELFDKLNLNYNIQGEIKIPVIGGGRAEFDLKYELEKDQTDNKIYYVIQAYNDFGRQAMHAPKMKEEFQAMLTAHQYDEFIKRAGSYYVARQRRAASMYAVITISNLNTVTKKTLSTNYKSNMNVNVADVGSVSASQTAEYKSFIKTAYKLGNVNIEYYATGTAGISRLANGFPKSPDDLTSILTAISNATSSVVSENSVPIEYHLASFEPYGLQLPAFDKDKSECLSRIVNKKLIVSAYLDKARKIIINPSTSSTSFRPYYAQKIDELNKMMGTLDKMEKRCREQGECCTEDQAIGKVYWLEDILSIDTTYVIADYAPAFHPTGAQAGRIIKSLRLVVEGAVMNNEYYCCLDGYYLDNSLEAVKTNSSLMGNTNPSLGDQEDTGLFKQRSFLYVIDVKNIDYQTDANARILYNTVNLDRSQAQFNAMRRHNYFIEVTSRDNLKNYFDLGTFDFNNIRSLIPQ